MFPQVMGSDEVTHVKCSAQFLVHHTYLRNRSSHNYGFVVMEILGHLGQCLQYLRSDLGFCRILLSFS